MILNSERNIICKIYTTMAKFRRTAESVSTTAGNRRRRKGKSALRPRQKSEVRQIAKSVLNKESNTLHYETQGTGTTSTPGVAACQPVLGGIAHGDADNQFHGNELNPQGLDFRIHLQGVVSSGIARLIVFQQYSTQAGLPTAIFPEVISTNNALAFYDTDNVGKGIKVLHDSKHDLSFDSGNSDNTHYMQFHIPGEKIKNPGWDQSVGRFTSNSLYWAICTTVAGTCNYSYAMKMSYKNM